MQLVGTLDPEEARTRAASQWPVPLQQPLLRNHALGALAVYLAAELLDCERGDHPRPV